MIEVVKKRPCCKMGRSVATRRRQEQLVNWPAQARENSHGGEPTFKQGDGGAPDSAGIAGNIDACNRTLKIDVTMRVEGAPSLRPVHPTSQCARKMRFRDYSFMESDVTCG